MARRHRIAARLGKFALRAGLLPVRIGLFGASWGIVVALLYWQLLGQMWKEHQENAPRSVQHPPCGP